MLNIEDFFKERFKRLKIDEKDEVRVLLSMDRGHNFNILTAAIIDRFTPCSPYNHAILLSWYGEDKYSAMEEKKINEVLPVFENLKCRTVLGGDYSFICSNYGISCANTFACVKCNHRFDKTRNSDKDTIDLSPGLDRRNPEVEQKIQAHGFKKKNPTLLNVNSDDISPCILHTKLLLGNELYLRLQNFSGLEDQVAEVIEKAKLKKNQGED